MATQPTGPVKTLRMSREPAAVPIVDNPKLKPMAGSKPVVKRIAGKLLRMDDQATSAGGDTLMKAVPAHLPPGGKPPSTEQLEAPGSPGGQEPMSVRLRLRITPTELGLLTAGKPLAATLRVPGGAWRIHVDPTGEPLSVRRDQLGQIGVKVPSAGNGTGPGQG